MEESKQIPGEGFGGELDRLDVAQRCLRFVCFAGREDGFVVGDNKDQERKRESPGVYIELARPQVVNSASWSPAMDN